MFKIVQKGDYAHLERFFNRALKKDYLNIVADYANKALDALKEATPKDTGKTAESWQYEIVKEKGKTTLYFTNSNEQDGCNVAVMLIYGHGTRNGGYVEGNDFVNPAIAPIMRELADTLWKEVTE